MHEFFTIATHLPVAPFAVLTALSVAWWLVAVVGGLDFGGAEGALDGAGDAALDGAADAALDGAAEGAVGEGPPALTTTMTRYVPITAWAGLFATWGWIVSFTLSWCLRHPLEGAVPGWVAAWGGLALSGALAAPLAQLTARPLAPLFGAHTARSRSTLVGEIAEVTTSRVDGRFGQARLMVGADDLLIQVRCDRPDNQLARGHHALVVTFDTKRDAFVVEPAHDIQNPPEA